LCFSWRARWTSGSARHSQSMDLRFRAPLLWAAVVLLYALSYTSHFLNGIQAGELAVPLYPSAPAMSTVVVLMLSWLAVVVFVPALWAFMVHVRSIEVRSDLAVCNSEVNPKLPTATDNEALKAKLPPGVMIATLEHVVLSEGIAVVVGGLGKAMKMYSDYANNSTRVVKFVFPMVGDQEYTTFSPVESILEGSVEVYVLRPGSRVEFIALDHPLFRERDRQTIYPDSRRPHQFLTFFSLWNHCIAELLLRYRDRGESHCNNSSRLLGRRLEQVTR